MANPVITRRAFLGSGATLAIGGLALALAGCDDDPRPSGSRGGTLRMAQASDIALGEGFPFSLSSRNRILSYATAETIIEYRDDLTPYLLLADSVEVNPEHDRVLITLKSGLEFHNGADVTSDDLAFAIRALLDPSLVAPGRSFQLSAFARSIVDVKVPSPRSVEIYLERPTWNILDLFAQLHVTHAASYGAETAAGRFVGTGPFSLSRHDRNERFSLDRFEHWHGASDGPLLDNIEVRILLDQAAAIPLFRAGDLDAYLAMSASLAAPFSSAGQTRTTTKDGVHYLGLNVEHPTLVDPRVRQAIFAAIDRDLMLEAAGGGMGSVTVQPWSRSSPAFDDDLERSSFDPEHALKLLEQVSDRQEEVIPLEYVTSVEQQRTQAELIEQNLAAVGIDVELVPNDGVKHTQRYHERRFSGMWIAAHAFANLTPLTLFEQAFEYGNDNLSHFQSGELADIRDQLSGVDPFEAEARKQYDRFNRLWIADPFIVPTGLPRVRVDLVGERVRGWPADPAGYRIAVTGKVDFSSVALEN